MKDVMDKYSQLSLIPINMYRYRTISVEHLQEMQDYMDKLRQAGLFSDNKVFRSYVDSKGFKVPESFQEAKSLIVMAIYNPLAKASIPFKGHIHEVLIPPNYRVDEFSMDQIRATIIQNIIRKKGYRIESVGNRVFLKHLATRSGLAEYGRNNISYVEGMGSMLTLFAFFTDFIFEEDHWGEVRMMDSCRDCKGCINQCPTQAISDNRFVIDVERCLPLYNEVVGEIPAWIPKQSHNALIGCMRCQLRCPANKEVVSRMIQLESLTEDETSSILEGNINDYATIALCQKLKVATPDIVAQMLPVFSRNMKMLINEV